MANGYAAIKKMAALLNCPTRRKALLRTKMRRMNLVAEHLAKHPEFDATNITLSNVTAVYGGSEQTASMQIGPVNMMIEPGQVIAVTAEHSSGKNTFLKLIARIILPTEGFVWVPSNLRMRFISEKPMIFTRSLMFNLTFGNQKPHEEKHIWDLCRKLGLSETLIGNGDMELGTNGEKVSLSNRILICIARALLSSADILLFSNSLDSMNEKKAKQIVDVLFDLVANQGLPCLEQDMQAPQALRKRKTVIYITNNSTIEKYANVNIQCGSNFVQALDAPKTGQGELGMKELPAADAMRKPQEGRVCCAI